MWMRHPDVDDTVSQVDPDAYVKVWEPRGWVETDPPRPPAPKPETVPVTADPAPLVEPEPPADPKPAARKKE